MSKSVIISIKPQWCELISSGKKTVEVRKTKPKIEPPFKCYIYENGGNQMVGSESFNVCLIGKGRKKVIGEFVCDEITTFPDDCAAGWIVKNSCATVTELMKYAGNNDSLYAWHISELVIYDKPKVLSEFGLSRAPQGWGYVEERTNK